MRRNIKPSRFGTDFWFGLYLVYSTAEKGSLRFMLRDGQSIPVNHRDIKPFIPRLRSDPALPPKTVLEEEDQKKEVPLNSSLDVPATPSDLAPQGISGSEATEEKSMALATSDGE